MDRLSPLDASFLHLEDGDRGAHMHIGSVSIFEGPAPAHDEVRATMLDRLHLVPRYRQRVQAVPFQIGRPVWVDAVDFDLDYHLRRTAVASPAGEAELRALAGRLFSQRLDRTKPLWELWVVEGLDDGGWAVISKIHHCLVDGVSAAELMATLFDLTPETPAYGGGEWSPREVTSGEVARDAIRTMATEPIEQLRAIRHAVRRPLELGREIWTVASGVRSMSSAVKRQRDNGLTGAIGAHRVLAWAHAPLADVKAARALAPGATVNDVVLAAVANGFRELLLERGTEPDEHGVRTLVPVSVRTKRDDGAAAGDGTFNNKVSAMFAALPVGTVDPVARLEAVRDQLGSLKRSNQAVAAEALTALSALAPTSLLALGARVAMRMGPAAPTPIETVTTNVPGPQVPLYCAGRRMLRTYPFVPVAAPLRTSIGIFSYDGEVTFTVTGDRDTAPDVDVIARGTAEALETYAALAADALLHAAGIGESKPNNRKGRGT
jgi:diacylglycerol O-acyltransferase